MSQDLNGTNAIITGAGNGLGLAIAQRFIAGGAKVFIVEQDPVVLKRVSSEGLSAEKCSALVQDLATSDAAARVFEAGSKFLGQVNVLVNDAAWSFHKPMLEVTCEEFDRVVHVNQRAPYFL